MCLCAEGEIPGKTENLFPNQINYKCRTENLVDTAIIFCIVSDLSPTLF